MTMAHKAPAAKSRKRAQGRPVSGENDVGRERLLVAAERLLQTLPPARVNISRIAEEADADPALVRYYFGDRIRLLMAVADRVTANAPHDAVGDADPEAALADHVGNTVRFARKTPFMHRLMIDELAQAGTEDTRARVREMNQQLVDFYRRVLDADAGAAMIDADPLLLHLAVLGASDFFASAAPLIRELAPDATDMDALAARFERFFIDLVMNGLRKR